MAQIFIVTDSCVILGNGNSHDDLQTQFKILGGGFWKIDQQLKKVYLYGSSEIYGQATKETIQNALKNGYISPLHTKYTFHFSTLNEVRQVVNESINDLNSIVRSPESN